MMAIAMACFTLNDALIKSLDGRVPVSQVLAIRGAFTCIALLVLIGVLSGRQGKGSLGAGLYNRFVLLRGLCELLGAMFFLLALTRLPFPIIAAILQAMPLMVTAGAALFLGEQVGLRRWSAIGVGLIGVLMILRPGTAHFEPAMLLMVGCVVVAAARDLFTRQVPSEVPTMAVSMTTALLLTAAGALGVLVQSADDTSRIVAPDAAAIGILALAALFVVGAMHAIVLAMRTGEVSAVVPFRYTSLLWATLIAWLAFDETPDAWTLMGGALVVATGLYTFARERRLGRAAAARDVREGVAVGR